MKRPMPGRSEGGEGVRKTIGGRSLKALRDQYRKDLFEDYVPFFNKYGIDRDLGGFMCAVDHDGTQVNTDKSIWYQGRGLWAHGFLYNEFGEDAQMDILKKTRDFVVKHGRDNSGNWYMSLDKEGNPTSGTDVVGYAGLFMAEGLMEYARATGDQETLDLAVASFWKGIEIYDNPKRESPQGYVPVSYPGMRIQGFEMVTIVLLSQLVQLVPDARLKARLDRAVDVVLEKFYNPEYGLNNEILFHTYDRPGDANEDFIYLGHAIETFWMMLQEAVRRKDQSLFDTVAQRLERALEVAWDDVYGGFFRAVHVNGPTTFDKVLWLQEEVLIGTIILMEHGDLLWPEWWFARTFDYVQEKFPLKKHGYPMWQVGGDRKVTFQPHTARKENYHHPRHLMLNLLALERMIERGGKTSGVFAG